MSGLPRPDRVGSITAAETADDRNAPEPLDLIEPEPDFDQFLEAATLCAHLALKAARRTGDDLLEVHARLVIRLATTRFGLGGLCPTCGTDDPSTSPTCAAHRAKPRA